MKDRTPHDTDTPLPNMYFYSSRIHRYIYSFKVYWYVHCTHIAQHAHNTMTRHLLQEQESDTIRLIDGEPAVKTTKMLESYADREDSRGTSTREDTIERIQFLLDYNADEYITKAEW